MGRTYVVIDGHLAEWMTRQHMFFVATAPLAGDGLVNCSPKGLDTLRITGPAQVVYLDIGGSGIQTVAHVKENGRIVIMFCAFEGEPKIVRLHGRGEVIERNHPEFGVLLERFPPQPVCRALVRVAVTRISDSCGWGVPLYEYQRQRDDIALSVAGKTEVELRMQATRQNRVSIEGLPGLDITALRPELVSGKPS